MRQRPEWFSARGGLRWPPLPGGRRSRLCREATVFGWSAPSSSSHAATFSSNSGMASPGPAGRPVRAAEVVPRREGAGMVGPRAVAPGPPAPARAGGPPRSCGRPPGRRWPGRAGPGWCPDDRVQPGAQGPRPAVPRRRWPRPGRRPARSADAAPRSRSRIAVPASARCVSRGPVRLFSSAVTWLSTSRGGRGDRPGWPGPQPTLPGWPGGRLAALTRRPRWTISSRTTRATRACTLTAWPSRLKPSSDRSFSRSSARSTRSGATRRPRPSKRARLAGVLQQIAADRSR